MALFSELPVYKLGYDLMLDIYTRTSLFAREYKYTLGEKLKNEITAMLIHVYKANKTKKEARLFYIDEARQNIEVVRLLMRLCKDLKILSIKAHVSINVKVEELSKQLASWHKYTVGAHIKESNNK